MKSVSIVYKKPKKQFLDEKLLSTIKVRRSVDQYYTKLIEKAQQRNNQPQNQNIQKKIRFRNRKISESINIVKLSNKNLQQHENSILTKPNNGISKKSFSVKKLHSNIFHLNLPQNIHYDKQQQKWKKNHKSCSLKCLQKLKNVKNVVVVLSAEFILNEMNFWQQQDIQMQTAKIWKTIQAKASIVWIARRQNSLRKINAFIRDNNLNQDGVYLINPKKNLKLLTVSYNVLERDLFLGSSHQLLVINALRVQNIQNLHYSLFYETIPEVKHKPSYIHFVRVDMSDRFRFNNVLKVLSRELPEPFWLNPIIKQFFEKQYDKPNEIKQKNKKYYEPISNQSMYERIQTLKKNYSNDLNRLMMSRNFEDQSIPFIVGDMLKRNYRVLTQVHNNYRKKKQQNEDKQHKSELIDQCPSITQIVYYNRPVYIWKF